MRQESKGTKIKKVLDLDLSDSFDENFIKIVYDPKVIDIIRKDRHQSNEIIQGLHSTGGDDDNDFVHNLRSQIDETIRQNIHMLQHIMAVELRNLLNIINMVCSRLQKSCYSKRLKIYS